MQPGFYFKCGMHTMGFTLGFGCMWAHAVNPPVPAATTREEADALLERAARECPRLPLKVVEVTA